MKFLTDQNTRNQKGSALVILMVVATVSALTIASMQTYLLRGQEAAASRDTKLEFKNLLLSVRETVESDGFCNTPKTGIVNGTVTIDKKDIKKVKGPQKLIFNNNGKTEFISKGWMNSRNTLKIHDIRFEHISTWPRASHTFATSKVTTKRAQYYLIVEAILCKDAACDPATSQFITNKRTIKDRTKVFNNNPLSPNYNPRILNPYAIDIVVNIRFQAIKSGGSVKLVNNAKAISCFGPSTGAAQCEDMGRIWNPKGSVTKQRCEPHDVCYQMSAGGGTCEKNYVKMLTGYDISKNPIYMCMWCNSNAKL